MSKTICVYCASSSEVDPVYLQAATALGKLLAQQKYRLVYGAGETGLMGALADAVLANAGAVTGVIPRFMMERDWHHKHVEDIIVTETMHERKALMAKMADVAIALPGGCGTIEELMEVITWKQLGIFPKPILILNTKGYYDPLIKMLEEAVRQKFMHPEHASLWAVVNNEEDILQAINEMPLAKEDLLNFNIV